jgi:PelA/Pel-15E family pectate lyase
MTTRSISRDLPLAARVTGIVDFLLVLFLGSASGFAADARSYLRRPPEWFKTEEASRIGTNIISWQAASGGWPKNIDTASSICTNTNALRGTFDNGATTGELRFLGKLCGAGRGDPFKAAFQKQFSYILDAQYAKGGWPQSKPAHNNYGHYITYNDNTFLRLAELARDVAKSPEFNFVQPDLRARATVAFDRAIQCVLRTQIKVDGELTVWCAQHDEKTLEPRPARAFELVSLSGFESAGLLLLLMSLEDLTPEIRRAIDAGARWFERTQITGLREVRDNGNKRVIKDSSAPPLWARFYEIGTNRPIFAGRDGVKRYSLDEIEAERRNGYAWYGLWGTAVLDRHKSLARR